VVDEQAIGAVRDPAEQHLDVGSTSQGLDVLWIVFQSLCPPP
jgi:hypothetical protein